MLSEDFEFLLSQFADGTLPPEQHAEVERRLAADPEARAELEKYRRLDTVIRAAGPVPTVDWNRLAAHLSETIADEAAPAPTYSIGLRRVIWAAAAILFLAFGLFAWQFIPHSPRSNVAIVAPQPQPILAAVIDVQGPKAQAPAGPSFLEVTVARPLGFDTAQYADDGGLVIRRPLISLAAAGPVNATGIH